MKNKKTIKFWTESEIKAARTALEKIKSVQKAAIWLAAKLNRPLSGTTAKLYQIKNENSESRKEAKIEIDNTFQSFEIIPKKVIMYKRRMEIFY